MSRFHIAYFSLPQPHSGIDAVLRLNKSLDLQFATSSWGYTLGNSQSLDKRELQSRTLEQFAVEAEDLATGPIAEWIGSNFSFSIGFLTDGALRTAIFEISEASLERMNLALEERKLDILYYLCNLYIALRAQGMVMGPELEYPEAVEVLVGRSTTTADIRVSIGIPNDRLPSVHVRRARRVDCHDVLALVEWFPGCPELRGYLETKPL